MNGGGDAVRGCVIVVSRSVVVVVRTLVTVQDFVCVSVSVLVVGWTSDEQAEESVWAAQIDRAVGVGSAGWLTGMAGVKARLLIALVVPL